MARPSQMNTQATIIGPTSIAWQGTAGFGVLSTYPVISQRLVDHLGLLPSGNIAEIDPSERLLKRYFESVKDTTLYHIRLVTEADQEPVPKLVEVLVMKEGEHEDNRDGFEFRLGDIWEQTERPAYDFDEMKFLRREGLKVKDKKSGFFRKCFICCWLTAYVVKSWFK